MIYNQYPRSTCRHCKTYASWPRLPRYQRRRTFFTSKHISEITVLPVRQIHECLSGTTVNIRSNPTSTSKKKRKRQNDSLSGTTKTSYLVHLDLYTRPVLRFLLHKELFFFLDRFSIPSCVFPRQQPTDDQQQQRAGEVTDTNDDPRDMVPAVDAIQPHRSARVRKANNEVGKEGTYLGLYCDCHINGPAAFPMQ